MLARQLAAGIQRSADMASQLAMEKSKRGPSFAESIKKLGYGNSRSPNVQSSLMGNTQESIGNDPQAFLDSLDPMSRAALAGQHPKEYQALAQDQERTLKNEKLKSDVEEKGRKIKGIAEGFDRLDELSDKYSKGALSPPGGILKHIPGTKWQEGAEELDQLGLWTADAVYTHFNKGAMAQTKWADVKDKFAPNSNLNKKQNMARIKAMKRIMNLPPSSSAKKIDKAIDLEMKHLGKTERPDFESFYE